MTVSEAKIVYSDVASSINNIDKNHEAIQNQIDNVLTIPFYQIPGRPEFASSIHSFFHEFDDSITRNNLSTVVTQMLSRYVERITVEDVTVVSLNEQMMLIDISYTFKQTIYTTQVQINKVGY